MKDAGLIIAVNTDPKAPIFDVAHFGAEVDVLELLPALTEAIASQERVRHETTLGPSCGTSRSGRKSRSTC